MNNSIQNSKSIPKEIARTWRLAERLVDALNKLGIEGFDDPVLRILQWELEALKNCLQNIEERMQNKNNR